MMTSKVPTGFRHASAELEFSKENYAVKDFRRSVFRRQTQSYTPILLSKDAKRRQEVRNRSADLTSSQWTGQHSSPKMHKENGIGHQRGRDTSRDATDEFRGLCVIDDDGISPCASSAMSTSFPSCQRLNGAKKVSGSLNDARRSPNAFTMHEQGKRADKERAWEMTSQKRHREHGKEVSSRGTCQGLNVHSETARADADFPSNSVPEGSARLPTTSESDSPNIFDSRGGAPCISKVAKTRAAANG
ncbi:unnamed protein product [Dibothriocephalus latus]|uniref:Uncharacterized protein n=1 Tax=Dibothriocephalus latus TaxID=60516 RepID=A0A3P6SHV1_DIBLA|nr:unnamed protein product [Dibothriocephalus latus]